MPRQFAYIESLPKKLVGAACVLMNEHKDILIMKPSYREGWLLPGGPLNEFESPSHGCIRKTMEEAGLTIEGPQLIGVFHSLRRSDDKRRYESVHFIFYGGILDENARQEITIESKSFESYKFVTREDAVSMLSFPLNERVKQSLAAMDKGTIAYAELVEE